MKLLNFSYRFLDFSILVVFVVVLFPTTSEAIPAFARKTNMACSTCHTAWPSLNAFGRQYKEHGYRLGHLEKPNKTLSKDLKWDKDFPISVELIGRPYDKKKSGTKKIRALHEVELMIAGPMGEKFSGFFEIEAEDEVTNGIGFDTGIPMALFSYNHTEALNFQLSWGSILDFDPYGSYTSNRRLSRGNNSVIDQTFEGADNGGKLSSSRQNITLYGRSLDKLFYGASISGDAGDPEGVNGDTLSLRVAYDVLPSLTVGMLSINGSCDARAGTVCLTATRNYSRTALDIQSEISGFTINAVTLAAKDDNATATASVKNNATYIQVFYNIKDGVRTTWAPLIRYDSYEKNGGSEKVNELIMSVNYYITENVRAMAELWTKDSDTNANDDDRLTLQIYAAF